MCYSSERKLIQALTGMPPMSFLFFSDMRSGWWRVTTVLSVWALIQTRGQLRLQPIHCPQEPGQTGWVRLNSIPKVTAPALGPSQSCTARRAHGFPLSLYSLCMHASLLNHSAPTVGSAPENHAHWGVEWGLWHFHSVFFSPARRESDQRPWERETGYSRKYHRTHSRPGSMGT
jgi:hypothetical protein